MLGGVTRNAVIGKLMRLGIKGKTSQTKRKSQKRKPTNHQRPLRFHKPTPLQALFAAEPPAPPQPDNGPLPPDRKPILVRDARGKLTANDDLTERCCRWPHGEPSSPDFGFCGKKAVLGLSFCDAHARLVFQLPQPRQHRRAPASVPTFQDAEKERENA